MVILVLLAVFVSTPVCLSQQKYPCNPPGGGTGNCVTIYDCPVALEVAKKNEWTRVETDFLNNIQCGYRDSRPTVCCPDLCSTPDGLQGKCMSIYACRHLLNIIQPPTTTENMTFIMNSKCEGPEQYSVCCGPGPEQSLFDVVYSQCKDKVSDYPPDGRTECCGKGRPAINYGPGFERMPSIGQYPWLALLEYERRTGGLFVLCGGALVSARFVLTAAHCLTESVVEYSKPKQVRLGDYHQFHEGQDCISLESQTDCTRGAIRIPLDRYLTYPGFTLNSTENDIGLVRMIRRTDFNEFIRPICLPNTDILLNKPADLKLIQIGWGGIGPSEFTSTIVKHLEMPIVPKDVCQAHPWLKSETLGDNLLCVGGIKGYELCGGESATPLVYKVGDSYKLLAVRGAEAKSCGNTDKPVTFTKVFPYRNWIETTIRNLTATVQQ